MKRKFSQNHSSVVVGVALVLALAAMYAAYYSIPRAFFGGRTSTDGNPIAARKAQILAIAGSGNRLTSDQKQLIFEALSGPRVLEYQLSQVERAIIVKAWNAAGKTNGSSSKKP